LYWGFFLDDPDHKRRRYCLICHIFKPERCHHCSACNRCVLNMDHHCPWLNNCVGFYNRKFFLLLILYVIVCKVFIAIYFLPASVAILLNIVDKGVNIPFFPQVLTLIAYALNCTVLTVMSFFYSFHVRLVISNMTTIEHMEKKRANEVINYDMGLYYNFVQIFGKNPYLWFIPVFMKSGKPIGDGVVWPQKPSKAQTYDQPDQSKDISESRVNLELTQRGGPVASFENKAPQKSPSRYNIDATTTVPIGGVAIAGTDQTRAIPATAQRTNTPGGNFYSTPQRINLTDSVQTQQPVEARFQNSSGGVSNPFSNPMPRYQQFVEQ